MWIEDNVTYPSMFSTCKFVCSFTLRLVILESVCLTTNTTFLARQMFACSALQVLNFLQSNCKIICTVYTATTGVVSLHPHGTLHSWFLNLESQLSFWAVRQVVARYLMSLCFYLARLELWIMRSMRNQEKTIQTWWLWRCWWQVHNIVTTWYILLDDGL